MVQKGIICLIIMLFLFTGSVMATHIVGGEFELNQLEGNRYRLRLMLYNDDVNGEEGAIDPYAYVFIWRKADNKLMRTHKLLYANRTPMEYNVPDCPTLPVRTSKVVYEAEITLGASSFDDPGGYYVSYERCCRNNIIDNIQKPESAGQAFYMEFPAVVRQSAPFNNSSPQLPLPPYDYLAVNKLYRQEIKATDPDGDMLVYRLVDPLAGYSSPESPVPGSPGSPTNDEPNPRPYPTVIWQQGYSTQTMISGAPALRITEDGFLEVKPTQEGLFVFALLVEEYRNGIKIGEVQREFQIVVYTPNNQAPEVSTSINNYGPTEEALSLEVAFGEALNFNVRVEDEEINRLSLRAQGEGFALKSKNMSFKAVKGKGQAESTFSWQPGCELVFTNGKAAFTLYFIGEDEDICNANEPDTLKVNLSITEQPNLAPSVAASLSGEPLRDPMLLNFNAQNNQPLRVDVSASDPNAHNLLNLKLDSIAAPDGFSAYAWQDVSGTGSVKGELVLGSVCEMLGGRPEALLTFYFSAQDDACERKKDVTQVRVLVKDRTQDFSQVKLVNAFTPNGDHCNAWFEIEDLPEDACHNRFEFIRIYNRWGKLLFESFDRKFKWAGEQQPAGTYYYELKYSQFSHKSPLSLILGDTPGNQDCANP